MSLSRNLRIIKENISPLIIAPAKMFSYAAQNIYTNEQAFQYFTRSSYHPSMTIASFIGVISGAGATYIAKIPAIFQTLGPQPYQLVSNQTQEPHFGWRGQTADFIFTKASLSYGALSAFVAYSSSLALISALVSLFNQNTEQSWTYFLLTQIAGAVIFVGMMFAYYSYDYQYSKKNANRLSTAIESWDFSCDKATMLKTLLAAGLNLFTFTATAYFWGDAASRSLITSDALAAKFAASAITSFGCVVTFLTVMTWLPSVYDFFKPAEQPQAEVQHHPANCASLSIKTATYVFGIPDSVLNQGLSSFMGVVRMMDKLFDTNPYGVVILLAACGLLTSAVVNFAFSIKSGADNLEERVKNGYYTRDNICYGLFGQSQTRASTRSELVARMSDVARP